VLFFNYFHDERRRTNPVQLTTLSLPNFPFDYYPAYSPDGTKIIFARNTSSPDVKQLFIMNTDGSNQTFLTEDSINKPSYSPDGAKIIYSANQGLTNRSVRVFMPGGSSQTLILNGEQPDWQPLQPATRQTQFDFDGDGKSDIAVFRPSNSFWYRLNSQNNSFFAVQFGQSGDKPAPPITTATAKPTSPFPRRRARLFLYSELCRQHFRFAQFGTTGDVPTVGDWDGDGAADLAVYRGGNTIGSQSNFYYRPSGTPGVNYRTIVNGTGGRPLAADFDGDGRIDPALFLPSAVWSILRSSDNQYAETSFGLQSDIPVPADYDGDGRANITVFRPSNGTWYTSQNPATNYGAIQFGANGDLPVPADYDGDGRADAAVFRPSSGAWYLNRSTAGFAGVAFGQAGDKPIPNALVP
jgi:hypothetical protein